QVDRDVRDRAEERKAHDQTDRARDREDAAAEQLERQDRLRCAGLDEGEDGEQHDSHGESRDQLRRAPGIGRSAEAREEDDGGERSAEDDGAQIVDLTSPGRWPRMECRRDHDERDRSDRKVDVEDPAPGQVVDEEAAKEWTNHRRQAEDAAEEPLVAAALAWRDEVADRRDDENDEAAAAEPLPRPEPNPAAQAPGEPA